MCNLANVQGSISVLGVIIDSLIALGMLIGKVHTKRGKGRTRGVL